MLLFGLFVSCSKQLCFGTAPSPGLSAGFQRAAPALFALCSAQLHERSAQANLEQKKLVSKLPSQEEAVPEPQLHPGSGAKPLRPLGEASAGGFTMCHCFHRGTGPVPGAAAAAAAGGSGRISFPAAGLCVSNNILGQVEPRKSSLCQSLPGSRPAQPGTFCWPLRCHRK